MYWLITERPENWEADRKNGFMRYGVPKHKCKLAAQIQKGDKLISYVSGGISCLADIRIATSAKLAQFGGLSDYDDVFPYAVETEPSLVLPKPSWVKINTLTDSLEFTKAKNDWRQVFRASIRKLSESDGKLIESAMRESMRNSTAYE